MKHNCWLLSYFLSAFVVVMPALAQQETTERMSPDSTSISEIPNLPVEKIGPNDLLGLTVYDSPELTREVRVDADGAVRLPMVKQSIAVAGLYPAEVENAIAKALVADNVLVDPVSRSLFWSTGAVLSPLWEP